MLKTRVIPALLLRDDALVKTVKQKTQPQQKQAPSNGLPQNLIRPRPAPLTTHQPQSITDARQKGENRSPEAIRTPVPAARQILQKMHEDHDHNGITSHQINRTVSHLVAAPRCRYINTVNRNLPTHSGTVHPHPQPHHPRLVPDNTPSRNHALS